MVHRKDQWCGFSGETAWGGGDGGAAKAATDWSAVSTMDRTESATIGKDQFERERIYDLGLVVSGPSSVTGKSISYVNPKLTSYLQTDTWFKLAMPNTLIVPDATPFTPATYKSNTLVFDNGIKEYQCHGCVIKNYKLMAEPGGFVMQEIEFIHYKTNVTDDCSVTAFNAVALATFEDVTVAIDADATVTALECSGIEIEVDFELLDVSDLGSFYRVQPRVDKVNYTFTVKTRNQTAAELFDDMEITETTDVDCSLDFDVTLAGTNINQSFTGLYLDEMNWEEASVENEQSGFKEYTLVFKDANAFAMT